MTPQEELAKRREQYNARRDKAGYGKNLEALRERIAQLEAEIGA